MRYLLIRTVYDKYFNNGFDVLLDIALKQSLRSRGIEESNYQGLINMFKDEPQILHL